MITKGSFTFIMGPCLIEDHAHAMRHAHFLKRLSDEYHVPIIYKSSYLKDNRTEGTSPRGPNYIKGMEILKDVASVIPTITDVHSVEDLLEIKDAEYTGYLLSLVLAGIQIPAMLSRQTSILEAAGRSGLPVMIKKGQWMDAQEAFAAARKVGGVGGTPIICERGNVSGGKYQYVDMELLAELTASPYPIVFDCTHSARSRTNAISMAKAAIVLGVDGIFAEVHEKPDHAPSDGKRMLNFAQAEQLIETCLNARR